MIHFALKAPAASLVALFAAACMACGTGALAQSDKSGQAQASKLTPAEKESARAARLKISAEALEKLYAIKPDARKAIESAPGYAVFDVTSIYVILFVGQKGTGVLFDNASKKSTYMTALRAGTGPGAGKQRVFQVFVFKSKEALGQFVLTGAVGGDVSGSISTGTGGSTMSFNPTIDVYQIPESGLALQASWGGTVYAVDPDLN